MPVIPDTFSIGSDRGFPVFTSQSFSQPPLAWDR